ncbi:hypothetical protein PFISCL1PPCAC_11525, partial [Pristionchus fissidentatus]
QEAALRIEITLLSATLLVSNLSTAFLTNRWLQILGDASYALYLLHWPAVCIIKELDIDSVHMRLATMLFTVVLSIICHLYYEKWYLSLPTASTLALVTVLYLSSLTVIVTSQVEESLPGAQSNFNSTAALVQWEIESNKNISEKEATKINQEFERTNWRSLKFPNCKIRSKKDANPFGFCDLQPGNGSLHFLIMGNSYAANLGGMILEHFRPFYGKVQSRSISECEPLISTKDRFCPNAAPAHAKYDADVEREQPDVLFLVFRIVLISNL